MAALVSITTEPEGISWVKMCSRQDTNTMTPVLMASLCDALSQAASDEACKVIILTGLSEAFAQGESNINTTKQAKNAITMLSVPVIAAVEGVAVGAGKIMAMAADMLVLSEQAYEEGGIQVVDKAAYPAQLHEAMFTGRPVKDKETGSMMNVNAIVPKAQVKDKAFDLAMRIAENSPLAIKLLKRALGEQHNRQHQQPEKTETQP